MYCRDEIAKDNVYFCSHVQCGMLHCKHQNERLEFGMESVSILAHTFINKAGSIVPCRTAIVDLGLNEIDPGLAPDGAKCGDNMVSTAIYKRYLVVLCMKCHPQGGA